MQAQIIIPGEAARTAATKAGWPNDACPTAWLETRIEAVFTLDGQDGIRVEAALTDLGTTAILIESALRV